jgi:two-component system, OmpR family, response regulator
VTPLDILYVDDDADIRHIVTLALSLDRAIRLRVAASGEAALALLDGGEIPDVALLDVMMPGMTGPELHDRLRARADTAALPVIFMTAKASDGDRASYRTRGAIGTITKPFDPMRLAGEVRALVAGSRRARA